MIKINDDTRITADTYNVIVQKRILRTPKDETKPQYWEWTNASFHNTLPSAYASIGRAFERELLANPAEQTLEELVAAYKDLWTDVSLVRGGGEK